MHKRKLVATAVMVTALAGAGVSAAVPASASTAATAAHASPQIVPPPGDGGNCTLNYWGGLEPCNSAAAVWTMPDGRQQVFAIGIDYGVWTRWEVPGGGLSDWVSLGGKVDSNEDFVNITARVDWGVTIQVTGTDGYSYYLDRQNAVNGSWDSWHR